MTGLNHGNFYNYLLRLSTPEYYYMNVYICILYSTIIQLVLA